MTKTRRLLTSAFVAGLLVANLPTAADQGSRFRGDESFLGNASVLWDLFLPFLGWKVEAAPNKPIVAPAEEPTAAFLEALPTMDPNGDR